MTRNVVLSCVASIVANMCLLAHEPDLALAHNDIADELLDHPEMPPELLDMYADVLAAAVLEFAPAFHSLLAHSEKRATAEPTTLPKLPQDGEYDALVATLNAPGSKGTQS